MVRVWVVGAGLLVFGAATQGSAQTPARADARVVSVTGGVGNDMGDFGVQVERYVHHGRASLFGGVGYIPALETGDASGPAFAGGVRVFTSGATHRAFLEGSVSAVAYQQACFDECDVYYGPGVQAGYQFVSRRGITVLTSVGVGYGIGVPEGISSAQLLVNIGAGYTWRRR